MVRLNGDVALRGEIDLPKRRPLTPRGGERVRLVSQWKCMMELKMKEIENGMLNVLVAESYFN